jgi:hypothetical protein
MRLDLVVEWLEVSGSNVAKSAPPFKKADDTSCAACARSNPRLLPSGPGDSHFGQILACHWNFLAPWSEYRTRHSERFPTPESGYLKFAIDRKAISAACTADAANILERLEGRLHSGESQLRRRKKWDFRSGWRLQPADQWVQQCAW